MKLKINTHSSPRLKSGAFCGTVVNQKEIAEYLKKFKAKTTLTINQIDKIFGYKYTAGHWFRSDSSGALPNKEDWVVLKSILKLDDKFDKQMTEFELKQMTFEQSLRISNWETPSDTITATGPEIHPNKQRRLSVRECAVLQSFPMEFEFKGSLNSMYRQVGNAVPVLLAKKIAETLKKSILKTS